jgi:small redox-active disulfide protein 2
MSLFGKKNENTHSNTNTGAAKQTPAANASVLILGSGCDKCNELEANTKAALLELGFDDTVGHVTDFGQIAAYGVMQTPALVVDGKVVSYGRVLKPVDIVKLLQKVR